MIDLNLEIVTNTKAIKNLRDPAGLANTSYQSADSCWVTVVEQNWNSLHIHENTCGRIPTRNPNLRMHLKISLGKIYECCVH